ncbi:MAG: 2-oxoacid:acceptor oxidoreductase subunit alpha [Patescibacteria group bacterium]|jgi:2-oxoglutarate ferredoxin oxidoreductase subunit alpha
MKKLSIIIGGPAGSGVKSIGTMLAKSASRSGFSVLGYIEYPSLIRGGHNAYQVIISEDKTYCATKEVDILVCLDRKSFDLHEHDLVKSAAVIFDDEEVKIDSNRGDLHFYHVPMTELAVKAGGAKIHGNSVALGAILALVGLDIKKAYGLIEEEFKKKGESVISVNKKALLLGYEYIGKTYSLKIDHQMTSKSKKPLMYISGNEAMALGAIAGGCRFYAAYPMTPSTTILHYLVQKERQLGMIVKQMEDEISVINAAIGAGWAGVRSFVGTSGGGFSLMVEALGFAAMAEVPLVVANVQRPGPSTGLPTWTEQSDLKFVLGAGHGDFLRIVAAPGDVEECFNITAESFNWAEKYQLPVVLLSDKYLAESFFTTDKFNQLNKIERGKILSKKELADLEQYKRYDYRVDGISPRSIPGVKGGEALSNSDEHDEFGFSTEETEVRIKQMDKRFKKLGLMEAEIKNKIKFYGSKEADITLIGWGSTKGAILEAQEILKAKGKSVNFIQVIVLAPFPSKEIKKIISSSNKVYVIENNKTGQLADMIEGLGSMTINRILKYDGRPFFAEEIVKQINNF